MMGKQKSIIYEYMTDVEKEVIAYIDNYGIRWERPQDLEHLFFQRRRAEIFKLQGKSVIKLNLLERR